MNTTTNTIGLSRVFAVADPVVAKPSSIITLVSIDEETVSLRRCGVTRLGGRAFQSDGGFRKRVLLLYGRFTVLCVCFYHDIC